MVTLIMFLLWEQSLLMSCWLRPARLPAWSRWDGWFLGKSREAHVVGRSHSNLLFCFWLVRFPIHTHLITNTKIGSHKSVNFLKLYLIRSVVYKYANSSSTPGMMNSPLTQKWFFFHFPYHSLFTPLCIILCFIFNQGKGSVVKNMNFNA